MENFPQSYDDGFENQWDKGYPDGGNYWSDYIGMDENSGPNQNLTGSDDIGDIPYILYHKSNQDKNQDNYPLMYLKIFKWYNDKDIDKIPDDWENKHGLNDSNPNDATEDSDLDNLTNFEEYANNTDPNDSDSDNDGLSDGDEIREYHTNPLSQDTDGDNFSDKTEIDKETDPLDEDNYPEEKNKQEVTDYTNLIIFFLLILIILILLGIFVRRRKEN